jgi:hypothetical protein
MCKLEVKVIWKPIDIPFHAFVEAMHRYDVEAREV